MAKFRHETIEKNSILMVVLTLIVVSIGGLVEIVPLYYLDSTIEKVRGMRPYTPLELAGRNIYLREGSQPRANTIIRFSGGPSGQGRISPVSADGIPTTGTANI